ncbi:MAG: hypothetical protein A3B10_02100 [Candidatus Doudnabacteria bacterium RIFCSPLOWO2_01_FULL_44_21]|uniref:MobA-like NTP transferase domain-containing protein n=1 Tax=Candidatus Doudnabacteria bacterium RIFCSPLOWO2_01_FULL_44_21 TaxID=1817841 RepID=A0A1F5Q576_9BACT|nr:MAG: hypothetical protein A3B95_00210 [Candidatus Doudnabacteria bacterium RIFCSPHIGHO2_02_FULL_43_13b]OGE97365.1 MAG: hypothetical protein A3B10_02100 [Candidatus Doudnabacteria bacterium RIFCSPLOWO2_01_FULL_44_21]
MGFQFIILAAGKGTRMNSALPKVLVGFRGKPIIQHLLDSLNDIQTEHKPIIVVGHKYDLVQSYLGNSYIYAFQEGQLGTAHAVAAAKDKVTADNVIVLYGDMPFIKNESLLKLMSNHVLQKNTFTMFTSKVPSFDHKYQVFQSFGHILRNNGEVAQIKEFLVCNEQERQITEVNPGIYAFKTSWLWNNINKVKMNKQKEYYLTDMVEIAIKNGQRIQTLPIEPNEVYGINTLTQLEQAPEI